LNFLTKQNPYPLAFIDEVLNSIVSKELYSFLNGFSGYNQVKIRVEDRENITFIIEWGAFVFMVMPFGLGNALDTFQRAIIEAFWEYIGEFMQVFLDDFMIYGDATNHLHLLKKCLCQCQKMGISLNLERCDFGVQLMSQPYFERV
jgi:hypothetical protein